MFHLQFRLLGANLNGCQQTTCGHDAGGQWIIIPRPRSKIDSPFARRLCPDLIIQPHPVSDVKPCESISWLLNRTPNVILEFASWFWCLGIGSKLDRYVIQSLDSKSDTNASGHPRAVTWSSTVILCVGFSVLLVSSLGAEIGSPSRHESLE